MRVVVLLMLFMSVVNAADKRFGSVIVSNVTSVYDADTFRVNIQDWPDIIGKHMSIRVLGVDAPEIRGQCATEKKAARLAKQFTADMLRTADVIELRNIKRGKYFRILAEVYVDNVSLADALIKARYARPYNGGKRLGWCGD